VTEALLTSPSPKGHVLVVTRSTRLIATLGLLAGGSILLAYGVMNHEQGRPISATPIESGAMRLGFALIIAWIVLFNPATRAEGRVHWTPRFIVGATLLVTVLPLMALRMTVERHTRADRLLGFFGVICSTSGTCTLWARSRSGEEPASATDQP
jgi:hypothetical protein